MKHPGWSYVVVLFLLLQVTAASAQDRDTTGMQSHIVQDPRVELLVSKHIQVNQAINTMDGFRIQIFSESGTNSKTKAQAVQDEFRARFSGVGGYLTFKSPNYKVRIGDFRTRLDAQRFLMELTADYPNAFIVEDQINLPRPE
jgi:hypothetical protein